MPQSPKPLLSIGIIFRNNIRSIERCLKALTPLREAIPCQLVMADTGSDDGSRQIAEQYADIFIDFPWINDFSAARNAVMNECSGKWFLTVDTDEYLDADVSVLAGFLKSRASGDYIVGALTVRNYQTYDMDSNYSDFLAVRLLRMSTGIRYRGAIHERWEFPAGTKLAPLGKVVLHHDGYVEMRQKGNHKKSRNMDLLREKVELEPENLLVRLQLIESGWEEPDHDELVRNAVHMVLERTPGWKQLGPPILRHGVNVGIQKKFPETDEWVAWAEKHFPTSYFTRIDIAVQMILRNWESDNYDEAIRRGEQCLQAYREYRAGKGDIAGQLYSTLNFSAVRHEQTLKMLVANAYLQKGRYETIIPLLESLDFGDLDESHTRNLAITLRDLHQKCELDTSTLLRAAWDGVTNPDRHKGRSERRRKVFYEIGTAVFSRHYRESEGRDEKILRPAYTAYLPLAGKCSLGTAAAILASDNPEEMGTQLSRVDNWPEFPVPALIHALEHGVTFPLPDQPLKLEEMDNLAERLVSECSLDVLLQHAGGTGFQAPAWRRGLTLAAVQSCSWKDEKQGLETARSFAQAEQEFLPSYYAPALLQPEQISILPPIHRFGFYCVQAYAALDAGDLLGYIQQLRKGLTVCEGMRPMVEFLMEHTPEMKVLAPSQELLELAEKVRTLLAAYAPDDPAVAVLKQSPAYQKVAYLVEGAEPPVIGGLVQ